MNTRSMDFSEVEQLVRWAADEGWNPGIQDAKNLWAADEAGFMVIDVEGKMAGAGAAFFHGPAYGFMGLFIMRPEFRGQGLGKKLWFARRDRLQERLSAGGTIGMDAVTHMIPFYAKGGFESFTRHCRFMLDPTQVSIEANEDVFELTNADWTEVESLDRNGFPCQRTKYLSTWIAQAGAFALGIRGVNGLSGYAVIRPCLSGWKIGPLIAEDACKARKLLHACVQRAQDGPVYLDVPENNPNAWTLCKDLGMQQVFECTRMYLGAVPEMEHRMIYGVTSLEAG